VEVHLAKIFCFDSNQVMEIGDQEQYGRRYLKGRVLSAGAMSSRNPNKGWCSLL